MSAPMIGFTMEWDDPACLLKHRRTVAEGATITSSWTMAAELLRQLKPLPQTWAGGVGNTGKFILNPVMPADPFGTIRMDSGRTLGPLDTLTFTVKLGLP